MTREATGPRLWEELLKLLLKMFLLMIFPSFLDGVHEIVIISDRISCLLRLQKVYYFRPKRYL